MNQIFFSYAQRLSLLVLLAIVCGAALPSGIGRAQTAPPASDPQPQAGGGYAVYLPAVRGNTKTDDGGGGGDKVDNFVERAKQTSKQNIVLDAQGGSHLAYSYYVPLNDNPALVYAYCPAPASSCNQPSRWQRVSLITPVDQVQLALTHDGQPRILARGNPMSYSHDTFRYGECDGNCLSAAAWHFTDVVPVAPEAYDNLYAIDLSQHYFALDPHDRPRFVFFTKYLELDDQIYQGGSYYAQCDADCVNQASWNIQQFTHVETNIFGLLDYETITHPALTFTKDGGPRVVSALSPLRDGGESKGIYYFGCDNGCDSDAGWERAKIAERGNGVYATWDVVLDTNDQPQIAYYEEASIENENTSRLYYLSCASDCARGGAWNSLDLGLPAGAGEGVDLALNSQGQPRMAYVDPNDNLDYSWCNAGCDSAASWQQRTIEARAQMEAEFPISLLPLCDRGAWDVKATNLTLDAQGNPHIAYRGIIQQRCYFDDHGTPGQPPKYSFKEIWHTIRLKTFAQP